MKTHGNELERHMAKESAQSRSSSVACGSVTVEIGDRRAVGVRVVGGVRTHTTSISVAGRVSGSGSGAGSGAGVGSGVGSGVGWWRRIAARWGRAAAPLAPFSTAFLAAAGKAAWDWLMLALRRPPN